MKKKALIPSILTIIVCLCIITGSTFALFTDTTILDISVTAGNVKLTANLEELKLYSAEKIEGTDKTAEMTDEKGKGYYFLDVTANNAFTNGGTAVYAERVLTLDKVTPGDKVTFNVTCDNESDVAIMYRVKVACDAGELLMSALTVKIGDNEAVTGLSSYTSDWEALGDFENFDDIPVEITLPITAGNTYKGLKNTKIVITVEAIQGNADVDDESAIETIVIDTQAPDTEATETTDAEAIETEAAEETTDTEAVEETTAADVEDTEAEVNN